MYCQYNEKEKSALNVLTKQKDRVTMYSQYKMQKKRRKRKNMTNKLVVKNRREWIAKIKEYRNNGYFLITFGNRLAELEKGNELVIIEY